MIACDAPNCAITWFHFKCVDLKKAPKSVKWFCESCKKSSVQSYGNTSNMHLHCVIIVFCGNCGLSCHTFCKMPFPFKRSGYLFSFTSASALPVRRGFVPTLSDADKSSECLPAVLAPVLSAIAGRVKTSYRRL